MNMSFSNEIYMKKEIGELDGSPVIEMETRGGLSIIASIDKRGKSVVLGAGPHRAVALHLASEYAPSMMVTELRKSDDYLPESSYSHLLVKFRKMTEDLRKL